MINKHGGWRRDQTTELMQFFVNKVTNYSKFASETTTV